MSITQKDHSHLRELQAFIGKFYYTHFILDFKYIYYIANWSTRKQRILFCSLSGPNFVIQIIKVDYSWIIFSKLPLKIVYQKKTVCCVGIRSYNVSIFKELVCLSICHRLVYENQMILRNSQKTGFNCFIQVDMPLTFVLLASSLLFKIL